METYGAGPPLLLVHGWAMHAGIWRSLGKRLGQHYRVICVDLPGHGRSAATTPFTLDTVARQLLDSVDEPCHWLGWSLGGTFALHIAELYPERVLSLVLMAATPCFAERASWPGVSADVLRAFEADLQRHRRRTLQRFLSLQIQGEQQGKDLLRQLKNVLAERKDPDLPALQAGLRILQMTDQRAAFARLNCPLLCILGAQDRFVPEAVAHYLPALRPDVEIRVFKRAGHLPFWSRESEVGALIVDFID